MRRIARRAVRGIEELGLADRAQLLEDVSLILPKPDADAASHTAFALREALSFQQDFFHHLQ